MQTKGDIESEDEGSIHPMPSNRLHVNISTMLGFACREESTVKVAIKNNKVPCSRGWRLGGGWWLGVAGLPPQFGTKSMRIPVAIRCMLDSKIIQLCIFI